MPVNPRIYRVGHITGIEGGKNVVVPLLMIARDDNVLADILLAGGIVPESVEYIEELGPAVNILLHEPDEAKLLKMPAPDGARVH